MSTQTAIRRLVNGFRRVDNERAVRAALLGSASYSKIVKTRDPRSLDRWLDIIVPKIIAANNESARFAAMQFDALRKVELGELGDGYKAEPVLNTVDEGLRHSLAPIAFRPKPDEPDADEDLELKPFEDSALAGRIVKIVLDGGRATMEANSVSDKTCLGFVRVTGPNPCAFCAMLASRGLNYRPYGKDAFKASNTRYEGSGDAKVHDSCGCSLKPVWSKSDEFVKDTQKYADMWEEMSGTTTKDAFKAFRRNYDRATKKA